MSDRIPFSSVFFLSSWHRPDALTAVRRETGQQVPVWRHTPPCSAPVGTSAITNRRTDERHYLQAREVILFLAPVRKKAPVSPERQKEDSSRSFPVPVALRMRTVCGVIGFPPVLTIARTSGEISKP